MKMFQPVQWIAILLLYGASVAGAEDLLTVYRQAEQTSPVLEQTRALLRAEQNGRLVSRAALSPHVVAGGSASRNQIDMSGFGPDPIQTDYTATSYSVTLTQPLFNGRDWATLKSSSARMRSAEAAVITSEQDLMRNVAQSYFSVLQAAADERTEQSRLELLEQVLHQTQVARNVGAGDVIAVQNALAERDAAESAVLKEGNAVRMARRDLQRLTHQSLGVLADLESVQPEGPQPNSMEDWVETALDRQPLLLQARASLQAREHASEAAGRAGWPTLSLDASYANADGAFAPDIEREEGLIGVSLAWPLFQGGGVTAARRQAEAMADATRFQVEELKDDIRLRTEQSFLTLQDSVAQFTAAEQALASADTSLNATQKGFEVGTRTVVDVLDAVQRKADAEAVWNRARYHQVLSRFQLKAAAGVLSSSDVESVNGLLQEPSAGREEIAEGSSD